MNATWNLTATRTGPFYWDNPYFERYENYETDARDRYVGYAEAQYDVADWLSLTGRVSYTGYSQLIELRNAVGSVGTAFYTRRTYDYNEYNYRLQARYNTQLSRSVDISGILGFNARRRHRISLFASTSGGLVTPGVYSLDNSVNSIVFPNEVDQQLAVNGIYASFNIDYNDYLFLRLTGRRDKVSSLPTDNNVYFYPSVSGSFQFSDLITTDFLSFGKIRASWARVGATADPLSLRDTYVRSTNFQGRTSFTVPNTKNNPNLKPEIMESWEVGVQLGFFNGRLYLDATYYNSHTFNQIFQVSVSRATGYSFKYINAGELANKGVELTLRARPIITNDFSWQLTVNWTRNQNTVVKLTDEIQYIGLAAPQGGVSIGAKEGEPLGILRGSDFVYHNGKKVLVLNSNGDPVYKISGPNQVIGNQNPEWRGGLSNRFSYQNWSLNILVDVRWGGEIFSLDQWYGKGTGLYETTVGKNKRGGFIRQPVDEGGGVLLPGVLGLDTNDDGEIDTYEPNTTYTPYYVSGASTVYGYWGVQPQAAYVYDGSYIKLREVGLTYTLPVETLQSIGIDRASISVVGRNLWLIYDNLPYADPEASLSAGNLAGYSGGMMPAVRSYSLNIELNF